MYIKRRLCFLMLAILTTPLSAAPPDDPHREPMPETLYSPRSPEGPPIFVDIDRVLLSDGTVDPNLFPSWAIYELESGYLDLEPELPCREVHAWTTAHNRAEPGWTDYSSVIESSDFIVVARVTGVSLGANLSSLGTLVRLKPLQWLKGEDQWQVKYYFFPAGEISLGDLSLCIFHDEYPATPTEGDRLLIAYDELVAPSHPWIVAAGPRVITLRPGGSSSIPAWIRAKHPSWVGKSDFSLLGEIRRLVNRENEVEP